MTVRWTAYHHFRTKTNLFMVIQPYVKIWWKCIDILLKSIYKILAKIHLQKKEMYLFSTSHSSKSSGLMNPHIFWANTEKYALESALSKCKDVGSPPKNGHQYSNARVKSVSSLIDMMYGMGFKLSNSMGYYILISCSYYYF